MDCTWNYSWQRYTRLDRHTVYFAIVEWKDRWKREWNIIVEETNRDRRLKQRQWAFWPLYVWIELNLVDVWLLHQWLEWRYISSGMNRSSIDKQTCLSPEFNCYSRICYRENDNWTDISDREKDPFESNWPKKQILSIDITRRKIVAYIWDLSLSNLHVCLTRPNA